MQKVLLSAAIALILVLVTALVGPLFVDWGRYRGTFEAEIARLSGLEGRIGGPIDIRLLPVPMLRLGQIAIGRPDGPAQIHAAALRIELALGPLMHGEFVVSDVALEAPEISLGLGGPARLERQQAPSLSFDPGAVAITHLTLENGRLVVAGGPNGPLVLDRLDFSGEARSLLGPAKGEGSVAIGGERFLFAIDAGRASAAGAARMRLRIDTIDMARRGDVDGTVWVEQGVPHIAGDLRWSQTGRPSTQGFAEPWRLSAKMRADWVSAAFEEIDLQYGAEDRALKFKGRAGLLFRSQPELDVTLAAARIDLDRMLALPAAQRRRPLAGLYAAADALSEAALPPVRVNFGLSADAVTLADTALERVSAHLSGSGNAWDLESLDLMAPGGTQMRLQGRLDRTPKGPSFDGAVRVEAREARPLVSWLADGSSSDALAAPFRAASRLRFGWDGFAFDRLNAAFDRDAVEGSITYDAPGAGRAARITATLTAPMLDLDRIYGLVQRAAGDAGAAWPREGALSLNVQRTSVGGIEAKGADVSLRFNERIVTFERLTIDDFAGSRIAAGGSVDIRTLAPRGAITLDLDVRTPDGVAAMVEPFSAPAAAALRSAAARLLPASLHGVFGGDAQVARAAGMPDGTSFRIDGSAGAFGVDMKGAAELPAAEGVLQARLVPSRVAVAGRVDVRDGRFLVEAAGLDRLVSVDGAAGHLDFEAKGRPGGPMSTTAHVTAGGLDVSLAGTLQGTQSPQTIADFALSVVQANLSAGQAGTLPAAFTARLNYDGAAIGLDQIAGTIAGSSIAGRVGVGLSPVVRFDGDVTLGAVDLPAVGGAIVGAPAKRAGRWSAESFAGGVLGQYRGQVALASPRGLLTPGLDVRNLRSVLNFGPSDITLDGVEADMAGGHVSGRIAFERNGGEIGLRGTVHLTKADAAALLPGNWPLESGRLDLEAELQGRGRSPAALAGSLQGRGSFRVENGKLAQFDPSAFDMVIRSVEAGMPIEPARIRERVEAALARAPLPVQGDGAVTVTDGKARLAPARLKAEGADLAISARYDLAAELLDARLTLVAPASPAATGRPEIAVSLEGPFDSPRRTIDVAAFSAWLSTRAAAENAKRLAALQRAEEARQTALPRGSPQPAPAATVPAGPPPAVARPLPPPQDGMKTDAVTVPPAVAQPETGSVTAAKPDAPANSAPAAKPDEGLAARLLPPPADPPSAAREAVAVAAPAAANPAAAESPPDPRITELDRVIAGNPHDGRALARRGQMLALRGNYNSAIKDFDEVIRLRPQDAEALNNRCWARAMAGDLTSALSDCNAALQLRPRYADALDSRGMVNLKSGQLSDAIADYDAALRINPKRASSLYGRGIAKTRTDDPAGGSLDIASAKVLQPDIAAEFAGYGIR